MLMVAVLGLACGAVRAAGWVTGYYPGWEQNSTMPATNIDFTTLTHVIHFALFVNSNGTLNTTSNGITPAKSVAIVAGAHAARPENPRLCRRRQQPVWV